MQAQIQDFGNKLALVSNGKVLARSKYRSYLEKQAVEMGYVVGTESVVEDTAEFSIRERFSFLNQYVDMVSDKVMPSLIITGDGGLGKTFTVMQTLKNKGLTDAADFIVEEPEEDSEEATNDGDYVVIKGFSTARGLYKLLWENKNKIVIFDDCDSVLKDPVALNLLKGALDSYGDRWISWRSERMIGDSDVPSCFKFKGQVIFISNMKLHNIDQAVRSRSICVDVGMTKAEKIDRMYQILEEGSFMENYDHATKIEAVQFIDNMKDRAKELSIRTLITVTKLAAKGGTNWKCLAEYTLTA